MAQLYPFCISFGVTKTGSEPPLVPGFMVLLGRSARQELGKKETMPLVGAVTLLLSHLLMSSPSRSAAGVVSGQGQGPMPLLKTTVARGLIRPCPSTPSLKCRLNISAAVRGAGRPVLWAGGPAAQGIRNPRQNAQDEPDCSPSRASHTKAAVEVRSCPAHPWPSSAVAAVPREVC